MSFKDCFFNQHAHSLTCMRTLTSLDLAGLWLSPPQSHAHTISVCLSISPSPSSSHFPSPSSFPFPLDFPLPQLCNLTINVKRNRSTRLLVYSKTLHVSGRRIIFLVWHHVPIPFTKTWILHNWWHKGVLGHYGESNENHWIWRPYYRGIVDIKTHLPCVFTTFKYSSLSFPSILMLMIAFATTLREIM